MRPLRPTLPLLAGSLACGGLFPAPDPVGESVALEAARDREDTAEQKRLRGDFAGAEAELSRRLQADPSDAHARRLLGDVNVSRGQYFPQKWKENLGWAWEQYSAAIALDPGSCLTWGRLAFLVVAAAENPATAIPRAQLDALPLAAGWERCAGVSLLELELRRAPTEEELRLARRDFSFDAPQAEILAKAAPWQAEAVRRAGLDRVAWRDISPRPPLAPGGWFVVLPEPSVEAGSVDGSQPRRFTWPEWISVQRVADGRIVFLDRRFPERVPATAVTRASACPGTTWELRGADHIPVGTCVAGPQDPRSSELYDETLLRPAGKAHFHHPSIAPATLPWETVAESSAQCLGGPVGRMFVDTPSCAVAYDRAIPQHRSIPSAGTGLTAGSREHAQQMVEAARSAPLFGEVVADHLTRGRVGLGMPHALLPWSLPDLGGCKGRSLFASARFVEGAVEFACQVGAARLSFRELTVVDVSLGG